MKAIIDAGCYFRIYKFTNDEWKQVTLKEVPEIKDDLLSIDFWNKRFNEETMYKNPILNVEIDKDGYLDFEYQFEDEMSLNEKYEIDEGMEKFAEEEGFEWSNIDRLKIEMENRITDSFIDITAGNNGILMIPKGEDIVGYDPKEGDVMIEIHVDHFSEPEYIVPPKLKIPKGQTDVITMDEIQDGTRMVDFHDEREKYHRYYTEDTYKKLNNGKNPFNNQIIHKYDDKFTEYIAELDPSLPVQEAGGRRRKTRRRKNKTIRMKKSDYLREHHHLFKVLSHPTRRVLARELKIQKKELKERGLKG